MAKPLFQLGSFQFDLPNGVPQTLERTAEYRWEVQDRLLRDPAAQFIGPGSQQITLDGVLFPGFSGRQTTMETLRELAAKGEPQMFTDGIGKVYGKWAIRSLQESLSTFAPSGGARQITFNIGLVRYVEDDPGAAAAPASEQEEKEAGAVDSAEKNTEPKSAAAAANKAKTGGIGSLLSKAGFTLGQAMNIYKAVKNGDYVGAALGGFGMVGFNPQQLGAWGEVGIKGAQMAQAFAQGRGPEAMAIGLQVLGPVTGQILTTLGGSAEGAVAIKDLVSKSATIAQMLDVDPKITNTVRQLVTQ